MGGTVGKHMQFPQEGTDKVGQASLEWVNLNNFSRLRDIGTVSVIATRWIRAGGQGPSV